MNEKIVAYVQLFNRYGRQRTRKKLQEIKTNTIPQELMEKGKKRQWIQSRKRRGPEFLGRTWKQDQEGEILIIVLHRIGTPAIDAQPANQYADFVERDNIW